MTELIVHRGGPHLTIQDKGRTGFLAQGVSRGGASGAKPLPAALMRQPRSDSERASASLLNAVVRSESRD